MAGTQAPICYINPPAPTAEPTGPALPPIPVATDVPSLIAAVAALTAVVRHLANQFPLPPGGGRITNLTVNQDKKRHPADFHEVVTKRVVKKVRVFNPQNRKQFVDVNQITGLTFANKLTGQQIDWQQNDPSIPG
jgi:hypothetical protein